MTALDNGLGPQGTDVAAPCEDEWPTLVLCHCGTHSVEVNTDCANGCSQPSCCGCHGNESEQAKS